jgi:hypothetical protein
MMKLNTAEGQADQKLMQEMVDSASRKVWGVGVFVGRLEHVWALSR